MARSRTPARVAGSQVATRARTSSVSRGDFWIGGHALGTADAGQDQADALDLGGGEVSGSAMALGDADGPAHHGGGLVVPGEVGEVEGDHLGLGEEGLEPMAPTPGYEGPPVGGVVAPGALGLGCGQEAPGLGHQLVQGRRRQGSGEVEVEAHSLSISGAWDTAWLKTNTRTTTGATRSVDLLLGGNRGAAGDHLHACGLTGGRREGFHLRYPSPAPVPIGAEPV